MEPKQTESDAGPKDDLRLLEVLRLLIETKKARTTSDLVKYASQYGASDAVERLRVLEAEGIPIELAFDALDVHLRLLAYKRNSELVAGCRGMKVGLILPLPPHVPELFVTVAETVFLLPDNAPIHGGLHEYAERAVKGTRAARSRAEQLQVLVFEAFRQENEIYVDAAVADVIEPKILPRDIRLIAHLRPHRNPGDVPYRPPGEIAVI